VGVLLYQAATHQTINFPLRWENFHHLMRKFN